MKRFFALLLIVLAVAACAPAIDPVTVRENENVHISFTPTATVYAVTVSVLNADTTDQRCAELNEGRDLGCIIGTVPEGTEVTLTVTGAPGEVYCSIFGFINPEMNAASFRTYPCN